MTAPTEPRPADFAVSLHLPRLPTSVAVIRDAVARALESLGVEEACIEDIRLAVSEACSNAVEHAASDDDYQVDVLIDEHRCTIWVRDTGSGFDPLTLDHRMPGPEASRGRGFAIMQAVMDTVEMEAAPGAGSVVNLSRQLTLRRADRQS